MEPRELAQHLGGTIAFPITPFHDDERLSVDWDGFRTHVDYLSSAELSALVVAGGTGEFFSLDDAEILRLGGEAVKAAHGRVPIIVGVGRGSAEASRLAMALAEAGVDGLLLMPPAYATPDPDALIAYYRTIASSVADVGCIVYFRDQVRLELTTLHGVARLPNVVAIKDGQGQVRDFVLGRFALGDRFRWLGGYGDDVVGAYAAAGADGFTSSLACFDPNLSCRLWELAAARRAGELDGLLASHVLPWYELRRRRRGYEVAVVKAAVEAFGGRAGLVRPPLANLTEDDLAEARMLANRIGKLTG
jgi:5-dehydro-4-deoxyglucarate dehydratase